MIRIYSFAVNRPDFLFYQFRMFQRFLKDEHQLIAINDGHDEGQGGIPDGHRQIAEMAQTLGIPSHTVSDPRRDTANYGHARAIQFACEKYVSHDTDISVLLDGDMFLARQFSIREYLAGYALAGLPQSRGHVEYLWPGLVFLDLSRLPDKETLSFWPDQVEGIACDVGGHSYEYLKRQPTVGVRWMESSQPIASANGNLSVLPPDLLGTYDDAFAIEILAKAFVHYRGGTNWDWWPADHHERKSRYLFDLLERVSSGASTLR